MTNAHRGRGWAAVMVAATLVMVATPIAAPAQDVISFTTLHSFDYTDGDYPTAGLVQAINGNLYGTTYGCGGGFGCGDDFGTVFKITPTGTLTLLDSFDATDGESPDGALIQAANGTFYGTTYGGGANYNDSGTVFTLTPGGTLTTLYTFTFCTRECAAGFDPGAGLLQGTNGNFYGTTAGGGAYTGGTIFEITSTGALKTLYSFCAQNGCPDGYDPNAALVQATDGNFYGTTPGGGPSGNGTVFKITPQGKLTTLHGFENTDGSEPQGGLVQGTDGNLYGTTTAGGNLTTCGIGCGTVFKISPEGTLTTLYGFCSSAGCPDGAYPIAGLIQATDGNFYGSTQEGGSHNMGTVFKMTPGGMLTTLHVFDGADGENPVAPLVQDTNGGFYGTTEGGGANNVCYGGGGCGTVFALSVGLGPFVKTLPASGKVGAVVGILGNNLTGATSVTFNGTTAVFTVISPSSIKTTVPSGATTGPVQVVTPGGTLTTNVDFRVLP